MNKEQLPQQEQERIEKAAREYCKKMKYSTYGQRVGHGNYVAAATDEYLHSRALVQKLERDLAYKDSQLEKHEQWRKEEQHLIKQLQEENERLKNPDHKKNKHFGPEDTKSLHLSICKSIEHFLRLGSARDQYTEEDYPTIEGRNELADYIAHSWAGMIDAVYEGAAEWENKYQQLQEEVEQLRKAVLPAKEAIRWVLENTSGRTVLDLERTYDQFLESQSNKPA